MEKLARAVLFDLDGTLIDSVDHIQLAANLTLKEHGDRPIPTGVIRSFIGGGAEALWDQILEYNGQDRALHPVYLAEFNDHYAEHSKIPIPYPDAFRAVAKLHAAGHPTALCTNKTGVATRAVLEAMNVTDHFDAIFTPEPGTPLKPDSAMLLQAIERLGPALCMVGDSEFDAQAAKSAGIPFVLYTPGYRRASVAEIAPVAVFDDYTELPAIIGQLAENRQPLEIQT